MAAVWYSWYVIGHHIKRRSIKYAGMILYLCKDRVEKQKSLSECPPRPEQAAKKPKPKRHFP
jgi:hypothetical protein